MTASLTTAARPVTAATEDTAAAHAPLFTHQIFKETGSINGYAPGELAINLT